MLKKVELYYQKKFSLRNRTALKDAVSAIFKAEKTKLSHVSVIFCSDSYLLKLNKDFLQHDYFTDVITFTLSEKGQPVEGEIYISVERVRENAQLNTVPFSREIRRVVFHGTLHLCGYNDDTKTRRAKMTDLENYYLNRYP